jgi:hypothetical protein
MKFIAIVLFFLTNAAFGSELSPGDSAQPVKIVGSDTNGLFTNWVNATVNGLKVDIGAATVTCNAGTGVATEATLSAFKTANHSDLGTLASSLSSIETTLTGTLAVSGPLTNTQLRASAIAVDGSGVIQPVSISSLPLPAGAATSTLQGTANTSLASIDSKLTAPLSVTGPLTDTQLRATAVPISVSSLPLPTGASTEATLSSFKTANHTDLGTLNTTLGSPMQQTGGTVNQGTNNASVNNSWWMKIGDAINGPVQVKPASTAPVAADVALVVALSPNDTHAKDSSLSTINTTLGTPAQNSRTSVNLARNDYTSTNVTTSAYVQLIASTSGAVNALYIFDSSGQTLVLATGGVGSEVNQMYIPPGGNGLIPISIAASTRVSIKAVTATANAGEINISFLQ